MSEKMNENYFSELYKIDCSGKVEKKNGLSYLSWAWAWAELKKVHPDATYTVYENAYGWNYHTDGRTAWVKTGVTVNGIEHIEYLPVMGVRNESIPLDNITSFDICKSVQRALTKAVARHGVGLFLYAGEDLPEGVEKEPKPLSPALVEEAKKYGITREKVAAYFKIATEDVGDEQMAQALSAQKAALEKRKNNA